MTILRQMIEHELDTLDNHAMASVYEHLHQLNRMRRPLQKRRETAPDINRVLELTAMSRSSWSEFVCADKYECIS